MADQVPAGVTFDTTQTGASAQPSATPSPAGPPAGVTFDSAPAGVTFDQPDHTPPASTGENVAQGFGSAAATTLANLGSVGSHIPFMKVAADKIGDAIGLPKLPEGVNPYTTVANSVKQNAANATKTTAGKTGAVAENLAEFISGDELLKGASLAEKAGVATKIAKLAVEHPIVAKIITHGLAAMRGGAVATGQELAHGATPTEALKTGAEATAAGGATGALAEGAGAAYKATKGLISPKLLQEPLQSGLRDVLDKTAKDAGVGGPPPDMKYTSDETGKSGNQEHHVLTTDADGNKIGELSAQNTKPDTVTVRSNQVYSDTNRSRGFGKAQIQTLLENTKAAGKKFVQSDISTTPDAQRPWRKLEQDFPDAVTSKEYKPKVAEGQPEPLGSKTQWTVDLSKYNPPAPEPLAPVAPKASASIRDTASDLGDKVMAESKADYQALDEATNGRFQRFRDRMEAGRRQLRDAITPEDEAPILKKMKETEDEMNDAYAEAKAKGVPPQIVDRADANYKKANALYDLDNAIKKSTSGAHPGVSHPDLVADQPETLDPKGFHRRINGMYDSGRLQEALGEKHANTLFDTTLEHSGAYDKIIRNRKVASGLGKGAAAALGLGTAGHFLGSYIGH
jgi:predicted GNAT family acetyltransferase